MMIGPSRNISASKSGKDKITYSASGSLASFVTLPRNPAYIKLMGGFIASILGKAVIFSYSKSGSNGL